MRIEEVATQSQMRAFIKFPWRIYRGNPHWVPPLLVERKEFFNPRKNPFFQHAQVKYWLAYRDREVVGRIAALVNQAHNDYHQEKCGFFGFFEAVNDPDVARALYGTAENWLKAQGMALMRGPANFSTNDEVAFLLEGFDHPPTLMMPYTPPYYNELAEGFGLRKAKDLYGYLIRRENLPTERILRVAERIKKKEGIVVRPLRMKEFDREVARVKEIYNAAWSKNWGFVPMTDAEFNYIARQFKQIVDPDLTLIAEVGGKPAGFCLALPDINQALIRLNGRLFPWGLVKLLWLTKVKKIITGLRLVTMGVVPEFQKRGIDTIFFIETFRTGVAKGYRWAELSWILEDNTLMNRAAEAFGAELYKKYRIYEKPL